MYGQYANKEAPDTCETSMQHGYAPYLHNIQTLAAVGVSHHGSFIFHGAECYYTPGGRSRMAQCGWLAFGKQKCLVHLRFHVDICSILVTKPHTHTHASSRCEMRLEDTDAQRTSHSLGAACGMGDFATMGRFTLDELLLVFAIIYCPSPVPKLSSARDDIQH